MVHPNTALQLKSGEEAVEGFKSQRARYYQTVFLDVTGIWQPCSPNKTYIIAMAVDSANVAEGNLSRPHFR